MTDLDKLKSLLDEWAVPYEQDGNVIILEADPYDYSDSKVIGYTGFVTHVSFDDDGKFRRIGIWE